MWDPNAEIGTIKYNDKFVPVYIRNLARPFGVNDKFRVNVPITNNIGIDVSTVVLGNSGWIGQVTEITRDTGIQLIIKYFNEIIWDQLKPLDIPKGDGFGYFIVVLCGKKFRTWDRYFWADVVQRRIDENKW